MGRTVRARRAKRMDCKATVDAAIKLHPPVMGLSNLGQFFVYLDSRARQVLETWFSGHFPLRRRLAAG